jgi:hypothetical protein
MVAAYTYILARDKAPSQIRPFPQGGGGGGGKAPTHMRPYYMPGIGSLPAAMHAICVHNGLITQIRSRCLAGTLVVGLVLPVTQCACPLWFASHSSGRMAYGCTIHIPQISMGMLCLVLRSKHGAYQIIITTTTYT